MNTLNVLLLLRRGIDGRLVYRYFVNTFAASYSTSEHHASAWDVMPGQDSVIA